MNEQHNKCLVQPNFGFDHSTEVSNDVIQTDSDTNILFTHSLCEPILKENLPNYFREEIPTDQCNQNRF